MRKNETFPKDRGLSRRRFLRQTAAGVAGIAASPMIVPSRVLGVGQAVSPNNKIRLAAIGAGGMGGVDLDGLAPHCDVVALCDVDARNAAGTYEKFPGARRFKDFRRMFEEAADLFEAVLVATPDHTHAAASLMAIRHGKHVYCEKPLAHSVGQVRAVMKAAREAGVVTQMGNQGHSFGSIRDCVEWIQAGAIGQVHTIHAGAEAVNSALDRLPRLNEEHAVPPTLDWDCWLGPTPFRPYHPAYLPASWRGWTAFGNGTLGDWFCHVADPVFWALDLGAPRSITARVKDYDPRTQGEAFPRGDVVTFGFPAKAGRGPVTLHWYSGTERVPRPAEFDPEEKDIGAGAVVEGDGGKLAYGSHGAAHVRLLPYERMDDFKRPPQRLPRVRGHHADWIEAIREGRRAGSDFAYGGALTEVALLGVIAIRLAGTRLEWDGERFVNNAEANALLNPPARQGWEA